MKKLILFLLFLSFVSLASCSKYYNSLDYSNDENWCFKETSKSAKVDTFFLAPASASGSGLMDLNDEKMKSKFLGSVKMEKGIYDEKTRFFSPYYREVLLNSFNEDGLDELLNYAYVDVYSSFKYYLKNYNNGNKIILAGFSEGAMLALRLLEDYINDENFYNLYVATYAIGAPVSNEYLAKNDKLKMAEGEADLKVIISFNSEDSAITSSFLIKENEYTNAINPLTWSRSIDEASKDLNKGAVFIDTRGNIKNEIANFCGCYIDSKRGTLKVVGVDKASYPAGIPFCEDGIYHIYDYQFFYNNLKENVQKRAGV